ncbi:MAG: cupin domain-containing protein [Saprospiraceae bacterium]|nr:cupin domain-containing protein [Saprospiraceae bacterium]
MSIDQIISSGLLELYVMGDLSPAELAIVEKAMEEDESVRNEVLKIEKTLEAYAFKYAVPVAPSAQAMLLATVNFTDRLKNGEVPGNPPTLNPQSKITDFSQWLERADMQEPEEYDSMYGRIINSDEVQTTMIIWLKEGAPDETHTDEFEKFLIVEGSCDITIGEDVHSLKSGNFLSIPLFVNHNVVVTSEVSCKIILQRTAA